MRFNDIFSRSWQEYKKNFKLFLKIYSVFYLIPLLVLSLFAVLISLQENLSAGLSVLYIIILIGVLFFSYWLHLTIYYISIYNEKNLNFKKAVKNSLNYFWKFLGLGIVLSLALLGLSILLIIPGIIFMIFWMFSPYVLMKENKKIIESMKTSKKIVKGKWWSVFGYFILLILIIISISLAFFIPAVIINFAIILLTASSETPGLSVVISTEIISFIFRLAATLITTPLMILFFKNFYLDLKASKK